MDENNSPDPCFRLDNIYALIPAYNEGRFIGSVVLLARKHATVIVIDDGSMDSTAEIAREAGALVLQHGQNKGKAAAFNTGLRYLKQMTSPKTGSRVRVVVLLDADGQHHPREIPQLVQAMIEQQADIVVGSRFLGKKSRIPRWRVFGQHALTAATNLTSGARLTDSQSGFRCISGRVLGMLHFESQGFSVESEMQFLAQQHNLKVIETPISVNYDEPPKRNPFAHGMRVVRGILKMAGQYRPLLYFGIAGSLTLGAGLAWGIVVVERFYASGQLAVGYAMISVLLSIIGMLLLSTGFILHSVRALLNDALQRKEK